MASKICTVRASDPSIEQRFNMLDGLGMAAELLGGGKPAPGGRKSADAADRAFRGAPRGAICGGIQPGVILSGAGTIAWETCGAVNNISGLRSALEAVVEESGWETDSSFGSTQKSVDSSAASHGWEELERSCAAMDSNNVPIDCIDLTNMLEEGVAPDSDNASIEDDKNEDRDGSDDSTNADERTPHFSADAPASRPAARPASRLNHTFSPINRPDVAAAVETPPPNLHRRSSLSSAPDSVRLGNANESNHADRAAARDSHGGKYAYSGKYYSGSRSQAHYYSDSSPRLKGSPARCSSEEYAPHSGPLSGGAHSGSLLCDGPPSESPHSGPLRHGFGVTVASAAARLRPTSSGETGATGEGRPVQAGLNKGATVAPPSQQRPSVPAAVGNPAAAGICKPGGVTVLVKNGANPAAIEAYFKLKAQRGR
ncbi:unnamed protein product [Closterium sp. Yama58-4]|nr:unnamed protein product [Closterium sp. Yama58-4]